MQRWTPIAILLAAVTLCGCAGMGDRISEFWRAGSWWRAAQTDDLSQRARDLEKAGELAMALDHWRLIGHIAVDQSQARSEISRLEGKMAAALEAHYQHGMQKMKAGEATAARNHFLAALRLDSSFQPARQQIKAGFSPFPLVGYHTVPGDRPDTIAKNVFGNADHAFLITWFNDLPKDAQIAPHTLLILPKLEKGSVKKQPEKRPLTRLDEARARLSDGDLEVALELSSQLNTDDPAVQSLIHTIHLKQAMVQIDAGLLDKAGQSLSMVPDGVAGKAAALETLQGTLTQRQLALDMQNAQRLYNENDFKGSLDLATAVLGQAPENSEARLLADEARYRWALDLFNRQQLIKARTVLEEADNDYAPSIALKEAVTVRLKTLAQTHYRNGVKHFINENLKAAVDEWEKALECNPDLEKAREDIENARRILEKIETMP
jgi:tetratricopeptide (TPR) repeat protein